MYLLFKYKNIMPSDYVVKNRSERIILAAFMKRLIEDIQEEYNQIGGG